MPYHQNNKRGDLRPEFFIMPPFKTAGLMSGGAIWSALAPLGRATTRLRNGYAYPGTAARGRTAWRSPPQTRRKPDGFPPRDFEPQRDAGGAGSYR